MGCREAIFVDELSAIDFPIFLPVSYFSYFLSNHATGHPGKVATKFLAFYLVWIQVRQVVVFGQINFHFHMKILPL